MANRHVTVGAVGLLGVLSAVAGCQANHGASADAYPQPRFDAPRQAVVPPVAPPAVASAAVPKSRPPLHMMAVTPPPAAAAAVTPSRSLRSFDGAAVPAAWTPPVAARPWRWIVIHHSDTDTGGAVAFDKMHRAKGWDELGYDFVIGNGTDTADGQVEVGSRWTKQKIGAHAKTADNKYNEYGIGICLVGNMMDHPPTAKQMAAVERLSGFLMATYRISPDHLLGHGNTKPTDCPGKYTDLDAIRYRAGRLAGTRLLADSARPGPGTELLVGDLGPAR